MPKPVVLELRKANTNLPTEVYNQFADTWLTVPEDLALNVRGNVEYPLTIPAGTYTNIEFLARLKGAAPPVIARLLKEYLVVPDNEYGFAESDPTLGRVDRSAMQVVSVGNASDLRNLLAADLTNKQIKLQAGDYLGYFEQTGAWNNVELTSENQGARFLNTTSSTSLILQGSKTRNRIAFTGFKGQSDATSGSYPLLWWNELGSYNGMEFSYLDLTIPNNANNAMGCVQYSTSSKSGSLAQNVWVHHNNIHDVGRCGIEFLSQGYDGVFRLLNLTVEDNTFDNLGIKNEYGMATSFSGLFRQIGLHRNNATRTRKIAFEIVNNQQVIARGNNCSNGKDGVGYGISDDDRGFTQDIFIEGGSINAAERPFYLYQGNNVHIDGQNQLWKGHRGIQMSEAVGCEFKRLNVLIHSTVIETGWEWTGSVHNSRAIDCSISSAGAAAAGFKPSFESVVLRSGSHDNRLENITTILGRTSTGTTYAGSPTAGNDGRIVDQGTNNTIINNIKSVVD